MNTFAPTPDTTIAEVLRADPAARKTLEEHGIDACCGGILSLRDAANVRGIPVERVLAALGSRPVAAEDSPVRGSDSVRAVLARFPGTRPVLERHGLMGCGGEAGPDESLAVFAAAHRIALEPLLGELARAAREPARVEAPPPSAPRPVFRPFLLAALASTATMGAAFGAYNLFAFHVAIGPATPVHNWVHANFQVMGFVLAFIVGVSYHAFPRFLNAELAWPRLARWTFPLLIAGLIVRTYGHAGERHVPFAVGATLAGAALQLVGVAGWAAVLAATYRRARPAREPYHGFLAAGTGFWLLATLAPIAGAVRALAWGTVDGIVPWNEPHYAAALQGGALLWIEGTFLRIGPAFLGLGPPRPGASRAAFWLAFAGALASVAGSSSAALAGPAPWAARLADAGLIATALSVAAFVLASRTLERAAAPDAADRALRWTLRAAFACGLAFSALATGYAGARLLGLKPGSLVLDGARHAFTLGFVSLTIFGFATRIVPVFTGNPLRWPALRGAGAALVVAGVLLRETQVLADLSGAGRLLLVSGTSGIVSGAGVLLLVACLWGTLRRGRAPAPVSGPVPIDARTNVAQLIAAHPEALPILVEEGFAPLANPLLRATLARGITLGEACRTRGKEPGPVVERLRRACPHGPRRLAVLPRG